MRRQYVCSICGKSNVKLWRPYMDTEPLVCAKCAEERQAPVEYEECTWKRESFHYVGTPTGRKLPLPRWKIDSQGHVPSYLGPGPQGKIDVTDQLIVNLKEVCERYPTGSTTLVPAVQDENGDFWGYTCVPEESWKLWENLPTR